MVREGMARGRDAKKGETLMLGFDRGGSGCGEWVIECVR